MSRAALGRRRRAWCRGRVLVASARTAPARHVRDMAASDPARRRNVAGHRNRGASWVPRRHEPRLVARPGPRQSHRAGVCTRVPSALLTSVSSPQNSPGTGPCNGPSTRWPTFCAAHSGRVDGIAACTRPLTRGLWTQPPAPGRWCAPVGPCSRDARSRAECCGCVGAGEGYRAFVGHAGGREAGSG